MKKGSSSYSVNKGIFLENENVRTLKNTDERNCV